MTAGRDFVRIKTGRVDYDVPLRLVATAEGVQDWAWHLQEKRWATKQMVKDFVELAAEHHGRSDETCRT